MSTQHIPRSLGSATTSNLEYDLKTKCMLRQNIWYEAYRKLETQNVLYCMRVEKCMSESDYSNAKLCIYNLEKEYKEKTDAIWASAQQQIADLESRK